MRPALLLTALLSVLAATPAFAHDTRPDNWCPAGSRLQVVSTFAFSEQALQAYKNDHLEDASVLGTTCNTPKSCGVVDEWFWANEAATATCMDHQMRRGAGAVAMPMVTQPDAFNHDEDTNGDGVAEHHRDYHFKQGLLGSCVICAPSTQPGSTDDPEG